MELSLSPCDWVLNGSHGKEVTLFSHYDLLASDLELAVGPWLLLREPHPIHVFSAATLLEQAVSTGTWTHYALQGPP